VFFSLFGLAYAAMGFMFVNFPVPDGQNPPPEWFGLIFGIVGNVMAVLMWVLAAAKFRVAKALRERTIRRVSTQHPTPLSETRAWCSPSTRC